MSLLNRNTGYPEVFYQELDILNARKSLDAPVAVVLKGGSCEADLTDMPRIIQMAETHKIVLQRLDRHHSIGQNLKETCDKTGEFPKKLIILAHGIRLNHSVGLEVDEEKNEESGSLNLHIYSKESVDFEDFDYLASDAQIFLPGCGSGSGGLDSLAQRIADISHRVVFAPEGGLFRRMMCLWEYPDGKWKMMSYLNNGVQHVYKFQHDQKPKLSSKKALGEACNGENKKNIRGLFWTYARSMEHYALGNPKFQIEMATCCNKRIPGCYQKDTIHWLLSAAEEGNDPEAQFELGCCYDDQYDKVIIEKSPENAFYWYRLAADQGHAGAQFNMGKCLTNGYGCDRSESRAIHYLQLAADQGHSEALYMMGRYLELGRGGLPISKQRALFYYGLALQKGFIGAQEKFDKLEKKLKWEVEIEELIEESEKVQRKRFKEFCS